MVCRSTRLTLLLVVLPLIVAGLPEMAQAGRGAGMRRQKVAREALGKARALRSQSKQDTGALQERIRQHKLASDHLKNHWGARAREAFSRQDPTNGDRYQARAAYHANRAKKLGKALAAIEAGTLRAGASDTTRRPWQRRSSAAKQRLRLKRRHEMRRLRAAFRGAEAQHASATNAKEFATSGANRPNPGTDTVQRSEGFAGAPGGLAGNPGGSMPRNRALVPFAPSHERAASARPTKFADNPGGSMPRDHALVTSSNSQNHAAPSAGEIQAFLADQKGLRRSYGRQLITLKNVRGKKLRLARAQWSEARATLNPVLARKALNNRFQAAHALIKGLKLQAGLLWNKADAVYQAALGQGATEQVAAQRAEPYVKRANTMQQRLQTAQRLATQLGQQIGDHIQAYGTKKRARGSGAKGAGADAAASAASGGAGSARRQDPSGAETGAEKHPGGAQHAGDTGDRAGQRSANAADPAGTKRDQGRATPGTGQHNGTTDKQASAGAANTPRAQSTTGEGAAASKGGLRDTLGRAWQWLTVGGDYRQMRRALARGDLQEAFGKFENIEKAADGARESGTRWQRIRKGVMLAFAKASLRRGAERLAKDDVSTGAVLQGEVNRQYLPAQFRQQQRELRGNVLASAGVESVKKLSPEQRQELVAARRAMKAQAREYGKTPANNFELAHQVVLKHLHERYGQRTSLVGRALAKVNSMLSFMSPWRVAFGSAESSQRAIERNVINKAFLRSGWSPAGAEDARFLLSAAKRGGFDKVHRRRYNGVLRKARWSTKRVIAAARGRGDTAGVQLGWQLLLSYALEEAGQPGAQRAAGSVDTQQAMKTHFSEKQLKRMASDMIAADKALAARMVKTARWVISNQDIAEMYGMNLQTAQQAVEAARTAQARLKQEWKTDLGSRLGAQLYSAEKKLRKIESKPARQQGTVERVTRFVFSPITGLLKAGKAIAMVPLDMINIPKQLRAMTQEGQRTQGRKGPPVSPEQFFYLLERHLPRRDTMNETVAQNTGAQGKTNQERYTDGF